VAVVGIAAATVGPNPGFLKPSRPRRREKINAAALAVQMTDWLDKKPRIKHDQ
jgi:hypothetical protein